MKRLRAEHGFTLFEALIVMPMMLLVIGGVVDLSVRMSNWAGQKQETMAQQSDVRAVVSTLVADLRQGYLNNGFPIKSISATSIDFYSPDRQSPFYLREIAYQLVPTVAGGNCTSFPLAAGVTCTLQRSVKVSLQPYSDGVTFTFPATATWIDQLHTIVQFRGTLPAPLPASVPLFSYIDDTGALYTGSDPTQVRRVVVSMAASNGAVHPSGSLQPNVFNYTDSALLRQTVS